MTSGERERRATHIPDIGDVSSNNEASVSFFIFADGMIDIGDDGCDWQPTPVYNRGLSEYETEFTAPDGQKRFDIDDWKGKRLLDLGSSAYNLFASQAAVHGVDVVSINPALKHTIDRRKLHQFSASSPDYTTQPSVAALAQNLPFSDFSFDAVIAVYSVPHYLHHVAPPAPNGFLSPAMIEGFYTEEIRSLDQDIIRRAFLEIIRILKIDGKAFLKDDHGVPGPHGAIISQYSPTDGSEVIEVLDDLKQSSNIEYEVHEKELIRDNIMWGINHGPKLFGYSRATILKKQA